jgi:hypothetical protein
MAPLSPDLGPHRCLTEATGTVAPPSGPGARLVPVIADPFSDGGIC